MKVIICDDDGLMAQTLESWTKEYMKEEVVEIHSFLHGKDVLWFMEDVAQEEQVIVLMDIKLEDGNGIEIVKKLRKINSNCFTIFISGYTEYVEDSFEADPIYYLLKPCTKDKFFRAMDKAVIRLQESEKKSICFSINGSLKRVFVDEIIYAESHGRKILLHTKNEAFEYYGKLKGLDEDLVGYPFVWCHKSFLVNINHVRMIVKNELVLLDGTVVPISRTKLSETKEKVFKFFGEQL